MTDTLTPATRRWTLEEYHRAAEMNLFRPEERLELIHGEIISKVSPQGSDHASDLDEATGTLARAFGPGYYIRPEKPLTLPDDSEPEPDIVVVRGRPRDYRRQHPTQEDALLVMEVSRATLAYDQGEKAALYAEAGIEDYWILNLPDRQLEVRREPALLANGRYGYRSIRLFTPGMEVRPLAVPGIVIQAGDLLPSVEDVDGTDEKGK